MNMRAIATISQSALLYNLSIVKQYAPQSEIVAMVKANAYGHHIDLVMPLIENVNILAVSELKEAQELRQITDKPILLLSGVNSSEELQLAININCHCVVHHISQITLINNSAQALNVWLKIDTGMRRLGLSSNEYQQCLSSFKSNPLINIKCIMSHFACADEYNHIMNKSQLEIFSKLTDNKNNRSMANSAAILSLSKSIFNIVRPGIMLYGASPFANNDFTLKPVMQLCAPVISIKTLQTGETVGYGATWIARKQITIAIIGIGYGDGYPRGAKNGTPVLINNTLCPLIGRVSMDMIIVDTCNTKIAIGDNAILWGDKKLRVETVAQYSDTISYELLSNISTRVNVISRQ